MAARFDTAIDLDDPTIWPKGWKKWTPAALYQIAVYLGICVILLFSIPNAIFDAQTMTITLTIGALGIWRYGWWFTHAIRIGD